MTNKKFYRGCCKVADNFDVTGLLNLTSKLKFLTNKCRALVFCLYLFNAFSYVLNTYK